MLYQLSHVRSARKIIKLAAGPDTTGWGSDQPR